MRTEDEPKESVQLLPEMGPHTPRGKQYDEGSGRGGKKKAKLQFPISRRDWRQRASKGGLGEAQRSPMYRGKKNTRKDHITLLKEKRRGARRGKKKQQDNAGREGVSVKK